MEPLVSPVAETAVSAPRRSGSLGLVLSGMGLGLTVAGAAAGAWIYFVGPSKRVEVVVGRTDYPEIRDGVPAVAGGAVTGVKAASTSPLFNKPSVGAAPFVPAGAEAKTGSIRAIPLGGGPALPSAAPTNPAPDTSRSDAIAALLEPPPAPAVLPKASPTPIAKSMPPATARIDAPARSEPVGRPEPAVRSEMPVERAVAPLPPVAPQRNVAVNPAPERRPVEARAERTSAPLAARPKAASMPMPPSAAEPVEDRVEMFGMKLPGFVPTGRRLKEAADQVGNAIGLTD